MVSCSRVNVIATDNGQRATRHYLGFRLEHLQHAISDHESTDHVRRGANDRDETEDRADLVVLAPAVTIEPTSEMPEIALVADIKGVCSNGGTREIT